MHALALKLLEYIAIGLDKDRFFFHDWFLEDSLSTYRNNHNMPRSAGIADSSLLNENGIKMTTAAHADTGFITLLSTLGFPGLQVEIDGEFKSIRPVHGQLVVNLGDVFSHITNYRLRATYHRVIDINCERFSFLFALLPKYEAIIPSNILLSNNDDNVELMHFG